MTRVTNARSNAQEALPAFAVHRRAYLAVMAIKIEQESPRVVRIARQSKGRIGSSGWNGMLRITRSLAILTEGSRT